MERQVIVITGPTCSGKTFVSLKVAEALSSEIISADSRQIFKHLNIGTAKPSPEILKKIKHHFIDFLLPYQSFDANRFSNESLKIIDSLHNKELIPVVSGGSGLYIKALVDGLYDTADKDENYRAILMQERELYGDNFLYDKLVKVDPESASKMIPQNWKRVMRALEVFHISGKSILLHQKEYIRSNNIDFQMYALKWDRNLLYDRINKRVDEMISAGLEDEVKKIISLGYSPSLNSLNTVGYKEIISYFNGDYDLQNAVELIKRNTRRYAKRQITWFNADKRIKWIYIKDAEMLDNAAEIILNNLKGSKL